MQPVVQPVVQPVMMDSNPFLHEFFTSVQESITSSQTPYFGAGSSSTPSHTPNFGAPSSSNSTSTSIPAPTPASTTSSASSSSTPAPASSHHQPHQRQTKENAMDFLEQVKATFSDQPEVYPQFLKIMKDFKSRRFFLSLSLSPFGSSLKSHLFLGTEKKSSLESQHSSRATESSSSASTNSSPPALPLPLLYHL